MKMLWLVLLPLIMAVACGGNARGVTVRNTPRQDIFDSSCTADEYKSDATTQMIRLQAVMIGINLTSETAVAQDKIAIMAILSDIESIKCRNAYPLKQETLEDTAKQFITALDRMQAGDQREFQNAIDRMESSASAFYDWSADME